MVRRNQDCVAVLEFAAAQPRDRIGRAQQTLRGELAERDDHLGLDGINLPEQELLTLLDLVGLRIPVARRPALDHVCNVHVRARKADGGDDLRQQLPRPPDERLALDIFIGARRLANKHEVSIRITDAVHDLLPSHRVQLAPRAIAQVLANRFQCCIWRRKDRNQISLWGGPFSRRSRT